MTAIIIDYSLEKLLKKYNEYKGSLLLRLGKLSILSRIINSCKFYDNIFISTILKPDIYEILIEYINIEYPYLNIKVYNNITTSKLLYNIIEFKDDFYLFYPSNIIIDNIINNKIEFNLISNKDNKLYIFQTGYLTLLNELNNNNDKYLSIFDLFYSKNISLVNYCVDKIYKINNELDYLNIKNIFDKRDNFFNLDKLKEEIYIHNNKVTKYFNDKEVINNRIIRSKLLYPYTPEIIVYTKHFYTYKYINNTVASNNNNLDEFYNALIDVHHNLWSKSITDNSFTDITKKFYYDKTMSRLKFLNFDLHNTYIVNNICIKNVFELLMKSIPLLYTNIKSKIHGDFILDNLLINNSKFNFIDWRQDFGGDINYGDAYYDLAKLNHSFMFDHTLMNDTNNFNIIEKKDKHNVYITYVKKPESVLKKDVFLKFIKEYDYNLNKINILSAIIELNMAPLHLYPLNNFLFYFGIYNLFKVFN